MSIGNPLGDDRLDPRLLEAFQRVVHGQCRSLLLAAQDIDRLTDQVRTSNVDRARQKDSGDRLWFAIHGVVVTAANIAKALWGEHGTRAKERQPLRNSIRVDDDSPLKQILVRSHFHFEHYDQRLDEWWLKSADHDIVFRNVGPLSSLPGFDSTDYFEQFDPSTGRILFAGESFDYPAICREVQRIEAILAAELESR
jgi:hypothetical protein